MIIRKVNKITQNNVLLFLRNDLINQLISEMTLDFRQQRSKWKDFNRAN